MTSIPTLSASRSSHHKVYTRFQYEVVARAQRVTIVCGAGISRRAGLRDFRSPDGLYHQSIGENSVLTGPELFSSSTLRDKQKLGEFNRQLTEMRITARKATLPNCHKWIERLHHFGRLARCYTQNIDGLQTRDFDDMSDVVIELHGTNVYLKCHKCNKRPQEPTSAFDKQLLEKKQVACQQCTIHPEKAGSGMRLRARAPGVLIPEVLFNEDTNSPFKDGKSFKKMKEYDSHCDLLLILGTSLKSHGAACLVRDLARLVHMRGGMVIYVNLTPLSSSSWSSQVDLHIQADVEEWASDNLVHIRRVEAITPRSEIALNCISIIQDVRTLPLKPEPNLDADATTQTKAPSTNRSIGRPPGRLHTSNPPAAISGTTHTGSGQPRGAGILFILCYHSWALCEVHVLQALFTKECNAKKVPCSFYVYNVEREYQNTSIAPEWRIWRAVVISITRFTQIEKTSSSHNAGSQLDAFEVLRRSLDLTLPTLKKARWNLVVLLGEDTLWAQEETLKAMSRVRKKLRLLPPTISGFGTTRLRLGGWAIFIVKIIRLHLADQEETIQDLALTSWITTEDFFEHTGLKVWSNYLYPSLLIAAPFDQRPLGRPLPPVQSAGCCPPAPGKSWLVSHDAVDESALRDIRVTVECSQCGHTLRIASDSIEGWMHCYESKYAVQLYSQE